MPLHLPAARPRSIRALLAVLFIVPLVSLLALWGFAASVTLSNALQEHNFTNQDQLYGGQAQTLGTYLALERSSSFVWLSTGRKAPAGPLIAQRKLTDKAVTAFLNGVNANPSLIVAAAQPALRGFVSALRRLGAIRAAIDSGRLTPLAAFAEYNSVIGAQFRLYDQLIVVSDVSLYRQEAASLEAGRALEMTDREVTLVDGALAADGQMSKDERVLFAQLVSEQRYLMSDALSKLDPSLGSGYSSVETSPAYAHFSAMENKIIASIGSDAPIPVSQSAWNLTSLSLLSGFANAEAQDRLGLASRGTQIGDKLLTEVLLAGGIGLLAIGLFIYLMARFGRRISRELTDLQHAALELATQQLPQAIQRLSRGEEADLPEGSDLPPSGQITEIVKVAEAFASVQRTAVEAAAAQARLRRGISQVFRNLAWRSQSLLHRQLSLLDAMERRSTEPETLEELFRLDHLTTRMRRHAEGLIILSGAAPGRGWREPVPLIDVLRGAVAEVEDYTRVSVITRSNDAVAGTAVADLIHLLAELIENAATNSPARTEVTVRAERVAHGIVIEIEDRGLGMAADELAAANERLANPPEFDLADSEKLGFFVVARLAARHQMKITLRVSPFGGVTAIVLLPHAITMRRDPDSDSAVPERLPLPVGATHAAEQLVPDVTIAPEAWLAAVPVEPAPAEPVPVEPVPVEPVPVEPMPAQATGPSEPSERGRAAEPDVPGSPDSSAATVAPPAPFGPDGFGPAPLGPAHFGPDRSGPAPDDFGPGIDDLSWATSPVPGAVTSSYPELPQRVRQASLHPELKSSPSAGEPGPTDWSHERTPVESGALLASLQRGWQRGRDEAEQAGNGADASTADEHPADE